MNEFNIYKIKFYEDLAKIDNYISCIQIQKSVFQEIIYILDNSDPSERLANTNLYYKQFPDIINSSIQYNAIIISIYSNYEKFIDNIFTKYIEVVFEKNQDYDLLPMQMKKKHIKKVGEFLSKPQQFSNYGISKKEVIENLYDCMNNTENKKINKELLLSHTGNLKIDPLIDLMKSLGIENSRTKILNSQKFIEYIMEKELLNEEGAKNSIKLKKQTNCNNLFIELNELVDARNCVSHGNTNTRISFERIKNEFVVFLRVLSDILEDILNNESLLV